MSKILNMLPEDAIVLDDYEDCIIGHDHFGRTVYDADKIMERSGVDYAYFNVFDMHLYVFDLAEFRRNQESK